jgi:hypothetical protein
MPGRLGPRFAVEAGFLVLLAVGAGIADLRPRVIVIVMAIAWVLVALVEFTADRLSSTVQPWRRSIVIPRTEAPPAGLQTEPVAHEPDSATVVAPVPEGLLPGEATAREAVAEPEPEPELELEPAAVVQTEAAAVEQEPRPPAEGDAEPGIEVEAAPPVERMLEPLQPRPKRRWFGRRGGRSRKEDEELERAPQTVPRHVRLLPPRAEPSRASQEVAEIFDAAGRDEREERGR